jgi:hypothetical protein
MKVGDLVKHKYYVEYLQVGLIIEALEEPGFWHAYRVLWCVTGDTRPALADQLEAIRPE